MFLSLFPGHIFGLVHDRNAASKSCQEFRELRPETIEQAKEKGYGVFFTPNGIGDTRKPNGYFFRWDGNVTSLNACFADFDKKSKREQMETIRKMPLLPSVIVESGRGYHVYWLIKDKEDVSPLRISLWRRIQTSIAEKYGTDTACSNPSRLLRLPGSYHVKREPTLVSVVELNNVSYTLAELEIAFPPAPRKLYVPTHSSYAKPVLVPPIECLHEGTRHPVLKRVAGTMYARSSESDWPYIRQALKSWYSLSCINLKRDWEKEVDQVADWVEAQERTSR